MSETAPSRCSCAPDAESRAADHVTESIAGGEPLRHVRRVKPVPREPSGRGPFRADQLRPGDPYELSDGHAIVSEPSGRRHGTKHLVGGALIATDPAVEEVGIEVGHVLDPWTLRAPDVSVGGVDQDPGFSRTAPVLAVEYVEKGRDERDLQRKIRELLGAGSRLVWVVRLGGEPRVEVHRRGAAPSVKYAGDVLDAPGVLCNAVPVEALYDRSAAQAAMLRNLLQRAGYEGTDALVESGRLAQARAVLRRMLSRRGLALGPADDAAIDACTDLATLDRWIDGAADASSVRALLATA